MFPMILIFPLFCIFRFRLTPLNMPDYAEVACSTFKTPNGQTANNGLQQHQQQQQSLYDSCGAYATTNLVANAKLYQNHQQQQQQPQRYASGNGNNTTSSTIKTMQSNNDNLDSTLRTGNEQKLSSLSSNSPTTASTNAARNINTNNDDYRSTMGSISSGLYSAPPSQHYSMGSGCGSMGGSGFGNMDNNPFGNNMLTLPDKMTASTASTAILSSSPAKTQQQLQQQQQLMSSQPHQTKKSMTNLNSNGSTSLSTNKINITENRFDLLNNEPLQPTRLNPFNSNSMQSQSQRQQQQQQQQQLLVASNALKQGLGAYANTTLATQMISGGGAGTLRRPRNNKVFKSENNINFGSLYTNKSATTNNSTQSTNNHHNGSHLDFLTNSQTDQFNDNDFSVISNSTNQLLNDWASNSSIAASDYHFGSKQPNKQHLYIKSKDGTWSAVSSDAYQAFRQQQQQQQQQPPPSYAHAAGDKLLQPSPSHTLNNTSNSNNSNSSSITSSNNPNLTSLYNNQNQVSNNASSSNSSCSSSNLISTSSSSHNFNNTTTTTASDNLMSSHNNKYFSSFGPTANV